MLSTSTQKMTVKMLTFLIDNIFVEFAGQIFQQVIGIPMGTNCAPLLADLFLYSYEAEFIQGLLAKGEKKLAQTFNFSFRYIDDLLSLNNPRFHDFTHIIYPKELELKDTTDTPCSASYLDLFLKYDPNGKLYTRIYDKRDDFNFSIVNFPFLCSNIPASPAYGVYISQLIRYGRACSNYEDFIARGQLLTTRLQHQGYTTPRLKSTFRKFFGRQHDIVGLYEKSASDLKTMESNNAYSMQDGKNKGLAYIIINKNFYKNKYKGKGESKECEEVPKRKGGNKEDKKLKRKGARTEYKHMKKLFKLLGFKVVPFWNKSKKDITEIMKEASTRDDLEKLSCFVCVIGTHGEEAPDEDINDDSRTILEHRLMGSDTETVRTQTLIDMFEENVCPALSGIPKMFFIQACRSNTSERNEMKTLDTGSKIFLNVSPKKQRKKKGKRDAVDSANTNTENQNSLSDQSNSSLCEKNLEEVDPEEESDSEIDSSESDTDTPGSTDSDSSEEDLLQSSASNQKQNTESTPEIQVKTLPPEEDTGTSCSIVDSPRRSVTEMTGHSEVDRKIGLSSAGRIDTTITLVSTVEVVGIPCHKDMLVMFASPPGKLAWREGSRGGWLLDYLYLVIYKDYLRKKKIHTKDFLTILTEVSHGVAECESCNEKTPFYSGRKMVPVIYHRLTKDIQFH